MKKINSFTGNVSMTRKCRCGENNDDNSKNDNDTQ